MKQVKRELTFSYQLLKIEIVDGKTKVLIADLKTGEVFTGRSECNDADGFDYEVGVNIATRRAIEELIVNQLEFDNELDGNDVNLSYLIQEKVAY